MPQFVIAVWPVFLYPKGDSSMDSVLSWAVLTALTIIGLVRFFKAYIRYEESRKADSEREWRSMGK